MNSFRTLALALLGALICSSPSRAADPIELRAGPLTMLFEPDNAFLRYVKAGSHEVLRGIYAPIRDQFWGTVRPVVSGVKVDKQDDHFTVNFDALCRERDIDFLWHGTLTGTAQGELEFSFDGTARTAFQRNRIGFCVLHPPSASGQPWVIENIRGEKTKGNFPTFISPHQPAKEIRTVSQELAPGLWAHVRMEGDTFEMEDQRNWTDASFKTYCTPLELPYPAPVEKGTKIVQKISIRLEGAVPKTAEPGVAKRPVLALAEEKTPLPKIGMQVSSQTTGLSATEQERLRLLKLDHLRADLFPADQNFPERLREAAEQAKALDVKLRLAVHLGKVPAAALDRLATEVAKVKPPVAVWLIVGAEPADQLTARQRLSALGGKALIGVEHEDYSFVQLNRIHPAPELMDIVAYATMPQMHAFDNRSIMETLEILPITVRTARQFIGKAPLAITPITLRLPKLAQEPLPGELPANVDPRQPTTFAAAWTLGSFKYLAEAGVESVTYFETVGWKGVMESEAGSALPEKFPSKPGAVYPVYDLLREFAEFSGGEVQRLDSTDKMTVAGLALRKDGHLRILVANLTDRPQPVTLHGVDGKLEVRNLDPKTIAPISQPNPPPDEAATKDLPLNLPPYGILKLDPAK